MGEVDASIRRSLETKSLQEDLQSLDYTLSLTQPKMGKQVERRRACSQDKEAKRVKVSRREKEIFQKGEEG